MQLAEPLTSETYGVVVGETDELSAVVAQLDALESAVAYTRLSTLSALHKVHPAEGVGYVVNTLHFGHGYSWQRAQQLVLVAVALDDLPRLRSAYGVGSLSWKQLVLLVSVATPDNEAELLAQADELSFNQLKALVRSLSAKDEAASDGSFAPNTLHAFQRGNRVLFNGDYSLEDGQPLLHAVDRKADAEGIDELTGEYRPVAERRADGLLQLASAVTAEDSDPDLATTVIHLDVNQLTARDGVLQLGDAFVPVRFAEHLLCDGRLQLVPERDGVPVGIGRVSRVIPHWLRRLVKKRDQGCRFPNCQTTKGVQGHHIVYWRNGGGTNLDNLISLCNRHHHLLHLFEWQIEGNPNGHVDFVDKTGRVFRGRPPALSPTVRGRVQILLQEDTDAFAVRRFENDLDHQTRMEAQRHKRSG